MKAQKKSKPRAYERCKAHVAVPFMFKCSGTNMRVKTNHHSTKPKWAEMFFSFFIWVIGLAQQCHNL